MMMMMMMMSDHRPDEGICLIRQLTVTLQTAMLHLIEKQTTINLVLFIYF